MKSDRFLIKLGDFYYYSAIYTAKGTEYTEGDDSVYYTEYLKKIISAKFGAIYLSQRNKKMASATNLTIRLNWINDHRKKLSHSEDQIKELVKKELKDIPLQKDRVFLVSVPLEGKKQCIISGKVTSVSGNNHSIGNKRSYPDHSDDETAAQKKSKGNNGSSISGENRAGSTEGDTEHLFSFNQETTLQLEAEEQSILNGSEPIAIDNSSKKYFINMLTKDLAGVGEDANTLYKDIILSIVDFQKGRNNSYHKGVLLYGGYGNGKSRLANNLFESIPVSDDCKHTVTAGTLIADSLAETTENLTELFHLAERDFKQAMANGEPQHKVPLHVYIIDEIDTLLANGDEKQSAGIIKGLCSILDNGHSAAANILIIGTTNSQPSDLDGGLVRDKRISYHVHISNPNKHKRKEIIKFYADASNASFNNDSDLEQASIAMEGCNASKVNALTNKAVGIARARTYTGKISDNNSESVNDHDQPKETTLILEDFVKALHPESEIIENKKIALQSLPPPMHDSVVLEKEQSDLNNFISHMKTLQTPGRHRTFYIQASEQSRCVEFCHKIVDQTDFINHRIINGSNTSTRAICNAFEVSKKQCRTLFILYNCEQLIKSEGGKISLMEALASDNLNAELSSIGEKWSNLKRFDRSSSALVFVTKPNKQRIVKDHLQIKDRPGFEYHCTLPDTFTTLEQKKYIREQFNGITAQQLLDIMKLVPKEFNINDFKELIRNNIDKKGDSITINYSGIENDLTEPAWGSVNQQRAPIGEDGDLYD